MSTNNLSNYEPVDIIFNNDRHEFTDNNRTRNWVEVR